MAIVFPDLDSKIKAEDFHDRIEIIKNFTNLGIHGDAHLADSPALESKHIYKPDLYGSPSPRLKAVSSQTHWRSVSNDWSSGVMFSAGLCGAREYFPVPGLCTRVKVTRTAQLMFMSSFYAFEVGGCSSPKAARKYVMGIDGRISSVPDPASNWGHEYLHAGFLNLQINGVNQSTTTRPVFINNVIPTGQTGSLINNGHIMWHMRSRYQFSICKIMDLSAGVHDVGVSFYPSEISTRKMFPNARYSTTPTSAYYSNKSAQMKRAGNVYFLARSMVADVVYR